MACAAVFGLPPFLLRGVDCFLLRMSCLFSKYLRRRVCATHEEVSFSQSVRSSHLVASDDRLRSRTAASDDNNNPILPEPRVIVIVASSRRVVVARELAHLLDVTGRHDSLSESSNRALRVFVLTHSHLRRHRSPSPSSVAASARASCPSIHPSVRASSSSVARAHLRLERALEREEVGKSTENERHRECSLRVVVVECGERRRTWGEGMNGAASLGRSVARR